MLKGIYPHKGHKHTEETKRLMSLQRKGKVNLGKNNGNWKGDNIKHIPALHTWIRRHFPKPDKCDMCDKPPFDLANITGIYNRDFSNWKYLCRKCHMVSDGRLIALKPHQFKKGHNQYG